MKLKKFLASALAAACAAALLVPTAFAHGCHGRRASMSLPVPCLSDGSCQAQGYHVHDGCVYYGHTHGSGACGGSCAPLCWVEGCTVQGRHVHDGAVCCGAEHSGGYCDGSCVTAAESTGSSWGRHGGCCHGGRR